MLRGKEARSSWASLATTMTLPSEWPVFVGSADPHGDGLHLSKEGQRFVYARLRETLSTLGLEREQVAQELPWGYEVNPRDPLSSLQTYQRAKHQYARVGVSSDSKPGVVGATLSTFAAGTVLGALLLLIFTKRGRGRICIR